LFGGLHHSLETNFVILNSMMKLTMPPRRAKFGHCPMVKMGSPLNGMKDFVEVCRFGMLTYRMLQPFISAPHFKCFYNKTLVLTFFPVSTESNVTPNGSLPRTPMTMGESGCGKALAGHCISLAKL